MATYTTNPTAIHSISQSSINLSVSRDGSGALSKVSLDSFKTADLSKTVPPDSTITLVAQAGNTEWIELLGTLAAPVIPKEISLDTLDITRPLHLRLYVSCPSTKRILASCERLSASADDEGELHSLLPVEPVDLGEQLWRLQAENNERPILQVHIDPNVGMLDLLKNDPLVQALVLPSVLEQVFHYLHSCFVSEDDAEQWMLLWIRFLEKIGCPIPDKDGDTDDSEWIKEATLRASFHLKLKTRYVSSKPSEAE